ncbi:FadR/GntR family transcriptional regulator [Solicola sp. PLA-1-18]|uniref:FadR/GntR family transcriptional regulator n=1 Tax=Solicola sp. PLA-1-18 TaxID=3380532 RepID=UPI003B75F8C0
MSPHALADAVLGPVRGHHAFEGCVEQLASAIRLGVFDEGAPLPPERLLAEQLGVSRATLREAIAALRTAGLVETTRGRGGGTVVLPGASEASTARSAWESRREDAADLLAFRRVVEPGACSLAASRDLGDAERELVSTALDEVEAADDDRAHRQADARLHLALAAASGSPRTVEAVQEVQRGVHEMLAAIPVLPRNIAHSTRQHRTIVRAVLAGDTARARRTMELHCDDTAALLRGLLQ